MSSAPGPLPIACAYSHMRNGRARTRCVSTAGQAGDDPGVGADRRDLGGGGVHPRVDVGVRGGVVALVVHRSPGVAAVHPVRGGGEVAAGPGLVAQRPHHHARVVLVALDRARDAVEVHRLPRRVVARVAPPAHDLEAVGLQVVLQHDPEPQLVGQLEHAGGAAGSGWCGWQLTLCRFIASRSARAWASSNTRPRSGWVSWRFIPRKVTGRPLTSEPLAVDRHRAEPQAQ